MEQNYIEGNLRNLIRSCCLDIEGTTTREQIESLLPIDQNNTKIWLDGEEMWFDFDSDLFYIIERDGNFDNFEILKRVMLKFNFFPKSESNIDKRVFQNSILMLLTK